MVKKILKIVVIVGIAAFVVLQFFRIDKTNPPVVQAETLEASIAIPPDVAAILGRSCNDCHSNTTKYPWYSNIQPSGWFLKNHIEDGRRSLNFSVWGTYTTNRRSKKLEQICEEIEAKEMPIPSYLWIHRDAVLSDADGKTLCDWAKQEKARIDSTPAANQ